MKLKQFLFGICCLFLLQAAFSGDCESGSENMAQVRSCIWDEFARQLKLEYETTYKFVSAQDLKAAHLLDVAQKSWYVFAVDSCEYSVETRQSPIANDLKLNVGLDL